MTEYRPWRQAVIITLAGPIAGRFRNPVSILQMTSQHEAGHAVIARSVGFHVGEVSVVRQEGSLGRAIISTEPVRRSFQPGEFKIIADRIRAKRSVALGNPTWTGGRIKREICAISRDVFSLVQAHADVLQKFAEHLMEAGKTDFTETEPLLDYIESGLNAEAIHGLEIDDQETIRSLSIQTLARVSLAAIFLKLEPRETRRSVTYWTEIQIRADVEAERRGCGSDYFVDLGNKQAAAALRLVESEVAATNLIAA